MSARIAVMFGGRIAQCDRPEEIYQHPHSRLVAEFSGGMNFLDAAVLRDGGDVIQVVVAGLGRAEVKKPAGACFNGRGITCCARPARMTRPFGSYARLHRAVP